MKWFAGIDWADTHHDVMVIDERGQQAGSLRVAHTKAGIVEALFKASCSLPACSLSFTSALPLDNRGSCVLKTTQELCLLILHFFQQAFQGFLMKTCN